MITNYTVTRETLDKLVEKTELQFRRPHPVHDEWYYAEDGGREVVVADYTNTGWGFHLDKLTWFCLAVIEANKWRVEFCYDKYDDKWSAEIEVKHGIWIAKPTLPEALAKALT